MPPEATTTKDGAAAPESPGDERAPASGADADLGVDAELARYVSATRVAIPDEKSAELRRSIDRRVLAVMMATYFLQAMDKGTLPFASIMGLIDDTGLRGQQYNWLSTCLFLAILAAEYPQSFLLARVPVAKYLGLSIAAWGAALACTAACTGFAALVAVRALLGLFESVCQPAFILVTATWYRRDEQASRLYCWYVMNGAQQVVGGLLAYCFSRIGGGGPLRSWQWLFLAYGALTVLFGCFVAWWMPDSPMRARCFSEADKRLMVERVRDNQTGVQNRAWKPAQFREGLRDGQTWAYAAVQLCVTLPTSGLGSFQGLVIRGLGFSALQTQLLSVAQGLYLMLVLLLAAWLAGRTRRTLAVMLGLVAASLVATVGLMTIPPSSPARRAALLACYYAAYSFWPVQPMSVSLLSRNVAGQTKKTVAVAANMVAWAAGNSVGAQLFFSWDAPRYPVAFAVHLGCYGLLAAAMVSLRWHLLRQNRARDRRAGPRAPESCREQMLHAWGDLTDRENPNFRYVF